MMFLSFSPVLMQRAFLHTALGSQWLILFSMYAYLKFHDRQCKNFPAAFSILALLAVGIHPYFLPLVLAFSFLSLLSSLYRKTEIIKNCWGFAFSIMLPVAGALVLGAMGSGVGLSRGGFGYWSMNINSILNPFTPGYEWSIFFKINPQILGNVDGFNYLGLGYLFLIVTAAISLAFAFPKWNRYRLLDTVMYIIVSVFMTLFALSNVITFNDKILVTIPLPEALLNLCGIFRASSRMFYFVYYSLVIFSLYRIIDILSNLKPADGSSSKTWHVHKTMPVCITLGVVCLMQICDLSSVIRVKHEVMTEKLKYQSILDDHKLANLVKGKRYLISDTGDRGLAVFAGKNNLATSYSVANSGDYSAEWIKANNKLTDFINGIHPDDVVVAYRDVGLARELFKNKEVNSTSRYYESNGFAFIIADKNTEDRARDPNVFTALALTDPVWTKGINNTGDTIIFGYSDKLLNAVNHSKYIEAGDYKSAITHVNAVGTQWIWVTVDRDAHEYAYPRTIRFIPDGNTGRGCVNAGGEITALPFTDQSWTKGINNNGNTILFGYSDVLLSVVNSSKYINNGAERAAIAHVDVLGNTWIWVTIDKDAHGYAFPKSLHFSN